ncbi:MAG: DegQ family serine endoprotease [Candidatus Tectomicrobia bacterium]|uniref:Probable periplasmic serine endoprotease DegP-like n=1 Tax=Tectimicrobiota bacterium TaxID=2528274 RepID=A0A932MMR9_UNCTE|nr:DegQ family serine endoprotease [Candidatus Tectomicrobia bacterium]
MTMRSVASRQRFVKWISWLPVLVLAAFLAGPPLADRPAFAAAAVQGLPSLADLAERLRPSVVNISAETVVQAQPGIPGMPGDPWPEMFRRFFEGQPLPFPESGPPIEQRSTSLGSGFLIDKDGFVLTNNHVIEKATGITVILDNRKRRKATVVGRDPLTDLALLKVEKRPGDNFVPVALGDSDKLRVGEWVMAIGNPFGLSHTVTAGIVSAKGRMIGAGRFDDFIQTDASINPGNSGGPLFNLQGQVVGINTAIFSRAGGNIGIGFAIPANMAKTIVPQLRKGSVVRGFLGVSIQSVNETMAKSLGLKEQRGAIVASVVDDSPAAKAGIRRGDVITSLNEQKIEKARDLSRIAADLKPGTAVRVAVLRAGKPLALTVTMGRMPDEEQMVARAPARENITSSLGIQVQDLTPDIARQVGVRTRSGVVITNVTQGSPAAQVGLQRGDVIIEVNQKRVRNVAEMGQALQQGKGTGNLFFVERKGSTFYMAIENQG